MNIVQELKTRNVIKVGVAYAVLAWIVLQLTETLSAWLRWPDWTPKVMLVLLIVGFIPAVILAWTFEITPEGVKLEKDVPQRNASPSGKGHKLDYTIVGALALAFAVSIWKYQYRAKIEEVESLSTTTAAPEEPAPARQVEIDPRAIAVLPFENRSTDPNDVYFTDGVHDDLLTQLSKIDAFHVISRSSVREYRDSDKGLAQIAAELGVASIMEGSVQKFGDRVRINAQLIDAASAEHLWAESFDRELTTGNLFDIQSDIARAIAHALQATLSEAQLADMAEAPTDNVQAYDLYLQARRFNLEETRSGNAKALELFQQALELDPEFKLGWIGLAHAHMTHYWNYGGDPAHAAAARAAIDRARAIDPDFPELFMAEGFYWYWAHLDYERALYHLEKAIDLMPGNAEAHMWHGWASRRSGLWEQGLASMRQSMRLDPRVSFNWAELGGTYLFLHRFEEARMALTECLRVNPDDYWGKSNLALLGLMESGDVDAAQRLTEGGGASAEPGFFEQYMDARILSRRFEEALAAARAMREDLEIQRDRIMLREIRAAQVLFFANRSEEARSAANAALFRLQRLASELGEDYRIDMAQAMLSPMLAEPADVLEERIQKSMASRPNDAIQDAQFRLRYARIFAMGGLAAEAVSMLEPLLAPPSETTVHTVRLDPAFDRIREAPEFIAMQGRLP